MKRWKKYVYNIFNPQETLSSSVYISERLSDNSEVSSPKYNEIYTIINELTSNKAAGADNVPPELIKNRGRTLKQKLYKLILKICDKSTSNTKE